MGDVIIPRRRDASKTLALGGSGTDVAKGGQGRDLTRGSGFLADKDRKGEECDERGLRFFRGHTFGVNSIGVGSLLFIYAFE